MATMLSRRTSTARWSQSRYQPHGDCGYCYDAFRRAINLSVGNHTVLYRHQRTAGGGNYRLFWLTPGAGAASRDDLTVRIEVCKTGLLEDNCEKYTNSATGAVAYKPTGILHDYGETDKMMFGLISGSFMHNKQGGVLRKQMGTFKDEVDLRPVSSRARRKASSRRSTASRSRVSSDSNPYTNPNYSYNCSAGWSSNQPDSWCRPWGNPIAEMMFESLRYFAGATGPEPEYTYTDAGSDDATLNMPEVSAWKDPYKSVAKAALEILPARSRSRPSSATSTPNTIPICRAAHWAARRSVHLPSALSSSMSSARQDRSGSQG